jgi:hypothetical protein
MIFCGPGADKVCLPLISLSVLGVEKAVIKGSVSLADEQNVDPIKTSLTGRKLEPKL